MHDLFGTMSSSELEALREQMGGARTSRLVQLNSYFRTQIDLGLIEVGLAKEWYDLVVDHEKNKYHPV